MNILLQKELDKIATLFDVTEYQMYQIRDLFYEDMENKTMLKMLSTYTYCNADVLDGEYLAIDFGGSNVRCSKFEVKNNEIKMVEKISFSLVTEERNYTTNEYTLEDIMNLIVDNLEKIIDKDKEYFLGHTFSFATKSFSKKNAVLIEMAKGFNLKDEKDVDINELLTKVINNRNLKISPLSLINDTTATLLTGNYNNKKADVAMILGTGHNACFKSETGEIINIESGYMSKGIPLSYFDFNLVDKLKDTKNTLMELLIGGKYLGFIAEEVINELFETKFIERKFEVTSAMLTKALEDNLPDVYSAEEKELLKELAHIILRRTAKLVVCEIAAILKYIDEDLEKEHCIVFDGSVYEKNKVLQDYIKTYLEKVYEDNVKKIETLLIKDASSMGAVISIFPLN